MGLADQDRRDQARHWLWGAYPGIGLAEAREKARETHKSAKAAADPLPVHKQQRSAINAQQAIDKTFDSCVEEFIEAKHGFRSTFRNWAGNRTHYPRDLAEAALAHTFSNKTEEANRRGDALEKRRAMMGDWSKFILG
ncbi:hypothetical protein [Xylophilus sp. GOD-11R]|uniref:hypothetical protein n=1 Tax=Xylophilus sp. GOD-11R TaxID=3089814 RepID=UPI00298CB334|nr:hypothetical protein [Xylophilus sp. GOD-11R]WPB55851.1 hypothetical protein R9X41_17100 [Xylophilus sp. GOD-11R]